MDPYHWSKQRSQPTRSSPTQPPSQSPRQQHQHQQPLPASSPPSFLSQPLMSAGFPTYPHQSHPPPSAQPPFQTLHHSQSVRDTIVPHPHSYQPVPTPLSVAIQHPLPQLPQLHHRSIPSHSLSTSQHTSKVAPSQSQLRIQHPPIQRAAHPPHPTHPAHGQTSQQQPQTQPQTQPQPQEPQQQPQQQQQQTQQQEQPHQQPVAQQSGQQPTQQPAQHHSQNPSSQQSPSMRPPQSQPPPQSDPQSNRAHPSLHPSPHHHHHHQHQQQQRSTSMQPPPRQLSSPNIPSPHSRDASPAQHIAVNSQVMAQQLSHIPQPSQQQQHLVQHPIQQQQPPPQQQPHHQHQHQQYVSHPPRQQQQPVDPARVVYDNSSVYRLSQPQQQYYNPYSTPQQHVQPQPFPQHPPLYSSVPIPNHEYQQQQSSMSMAQDSSARPFPSSRIPAIHQQGQPTAQHPRPPQGPLSQQQQPAQHMQSSQRQHPKLVSSLQPQPIQMVQIGATPAQQPQDPQSQHLVQQQAADQIHRQTMPPGQLAQSHQLGHSQQSRHMAQTQALPLASQHPHLPDRRTASSQMHPSAQGQMHMASAPIPTTMQLQQHQHQMQHQVMPGQPMQPRERHHTMQPLASQQPKPSHHQIVQPPLQSQPPPQLQPQTQTQTAPQGQAQGQAQSQPPPQPQPQTQPQMQTQAPQQQGMHSSNLPQSQLVTQQGGQSLQQDMRHHSLQPIQDSVPKQEQSTAGLPRADIRASSIPGSNRQAAKQENVPEQSGSVRQLKVEDALAYLEQVKSQFSSNPGVYNHFLDIMKEFKANTIDTAEVITRVSSLFQGHRELILGFNTFLPPGYRIELRSDPTTGCVTGFSSPGGVFFPLNEAQPEPQPDGQQQPVAYNAQSDIRRQVSNVPPMPIDPSTHHFPAQGGHPVAPPVDSTHQGRNSAMEIAFDRGGYQQPTSTNDKEKHLGIVSQSQQGVSMGQDSKGHLMQNAPNDNAAAALADRFGSPNLGAAVPGKPIEFDQAVTYVNKIKSRFSEDQQVYRTFLGILQTYQKEQKSIKEVYKQVSLLFKDHDDLLGEFSKFLPEQPSQMPRQGGSTSQRMSTESGPNRRKPGVSHAKQQPVIEGGAPENASPTVLESKGKESTTKPSGKGRAGKANANSLGATGGIAKPSASARHKASVQDKKQKRIAPNGKKPATDGKAGVVVGSGHRSHLTRSEGAAPELEFFDELRSLLGPEGQQNYSEFIKCLSLFSQEIICGDELMRLADGLLNHRKPLTDAFRAFLDQSDLRATQTAVDILRRAKTSSDEADGTGATARVSSGPPVINTSAVRERLRGLPPIADIGSSGGSGNTPGCRSPKLNPLYKGKPLSQIGRDFGTELAGTRSYVTLPANAVQIQCSGMTTNDRSVLNHMFVSKTDQVRTKLLDDDPSWNKLTGKRQERSTISSRGTQGNVTAMPPTAPNEDASSRSTWKQTAESLSIEDQRIELEVMIARAQSTVQKLEQLTKGEIRNASSFTAVDFKPIELIYKDAANDIIDVLRSNPSLTAPVVLQRVRQRLADWRTSQKKMEQLWKSSRFNDYDKLIGGPRTWRRSELKDELMRNGGSYAIINSGEKNVHYQSHVKKLDCELVCEDENLSVICDILWYAFEWEAENVETADKGLEFVERVYGVIQQVHRKGISMYVDEHLYVYLRLLTEASQRVRYILEHNYDGLTTESLVQKVKDVLGGTVSLPAYDDHCRKLYGDSGEWTAFLSDFPLVCKRLAEAALSVPQMKTANELLHLAEGSVQSEDSSEAHESDVTMSDEKENKSLEKTLPHPSSSHPRQRLRAAMKVAAIPEVDIFEVEVVREEKDQRPSGNSAVNCRVILRMRHVPKATAAQFERFKQTNVPDEGTVSSALTKYIRRALKRKRCSDALSGRKEQESAIHRKDGLDVRLLNGNGEIMYVMGTEDYLMKAAFVRRVSARLAKSHKHPRSLLPAKDDPKEISAA